MPKYIIISAEFLVPATNWPMVAEFPQLLDATTSKLSFFRNVIIYENCYKLMQDPIDNKIISQVISVIIEHYLFIYMYQILLSDFKLGKKSIDCKTRTKELISGQGLRAQAGWNTNQTIDRF